MSITNELLDKKSDPKIPGIPPNSATITEVVNVLPPSFIDSFVPPNTVNGSPSAVVYVEDIIHSTLLMQLNSSKHYFEINVTADPVSNNISVCKSSISTLANQQLFEIADNRIFNGLSVRLDVDQTTLTSASRNYHMSCRPLDIVVFDLCLCFVASVSSILLFLHVLYYRGRDKRLRDLHFTIHRFYQNLYQHSFLRPITPT